MQNRIEGIIVLGNTLLPVILAAIFLGLFQFHKGEIAHTWSGLAGSMNGVVESARQAEEIAARMQEDVGRELDKAGKRIERLETTVKPVIKTVKTGADAVGRLKLKYPNGINVKKREIDLKVAKPNVPYAISAKFGDWKFGTAVAKPFYAVGTALGRLTAPFEDLGRAAAAFKVHQAALEKHVGAVRSQAESTWNNTAALGTAVGGIATTLFYLMAGLFLWFTLSYVFWARRRLLRGWELVRHAPRPSRDGAP